MKPHLAFIQQSLKKKEAAEKALNPLGDYERYKAIAEKARNRGIPPHLIIEELEDEKMKILDHNPSVPVNDKLYQEGLRDSKLSCLGAIDKLIEEIKATI